MRRVDRLASLGVMASGIAHEIRNPLAGIKAMVQTFEDELAEDDPKREYMRRIVRLVNRLDKLIRTLFSYAKPSKPNRQSCNVESILVDVISLFRQKFKEKNIRLAEHVHPDLPDVFVDPSQIQQVLVNLILNSVEAIEKDGQIIISIQPVKPGEAAEVSNRAPYLTLGKSREYIEIKIQDNGCGISAENLQHIFNPFFTTKSFGTGLGLSIVYQIIKENDGLINYESEDGKGATCFLYLPAKM
jgi:signal transduction histidine kinase